MVFFSGFGLSFMHAAIIYASSCAIYKIFSMRVYQKCTIIIKYICIYINIYMYVNIIIVIKVSVHLNNHIKYLRRIH